MYKITSEKLDMITYKGKLIGMRTLYAKIVSSSRGTAYDRMYGKFEGFYVKFRGKWRKVHNVRGGYTPGVWRSTGPFVR